MKRREFITMLGGAALATTSRALAQSPARALRVGTLGAGPLITDASPSALRCCTGSHSLDTRRAQTSCSNDEAPRDTWSVFPALIK